MGCATMINYGLYNVLDMYFHNNDQENAYSGVQLNIISVVMIIGIVTVIMVVLIPKENVNELMAKMEKSNNMNKLVNSSSGVIDDITPEQELSDMIDENLEDTNKK
jgi:predicted DNA-binding ArsR family transcriptional regulator